MFPNNPPTWTEERTETLTTLWNKGYSASIIASQLGGITRNAVLGKAFRLKLPMRVPAVRKAWTSPQRRKGPNRQRETVVHFKPQPKPKSKLAELLAEPLPPSDVADIARVSLMDLERHHCRFPVGDPKDTAFGFCGCKPVEGLVYCEPHARRAYTAPAVKEKVGPSFDVSIKKRWSERSLVDA